MEKEREARIEKKEKQEKSWELLRVCMAYLKENEKSWKIEEEERMTPKKRKEEKNRKKIEIQNKKEDNEIQKKLQKHGREYLNMKKEEETGTEGNQSKHLEKMEKRGREN